MALSDYEINILLESNGKSLEVSRCYELIGCEASDYVVNTQPNALLDGAAFINNNVEPREISMAATCTEKRRDFLVRFFQPKARDKSNYQNARNNALDNWVCVGFPVCAKPCGQ